MPSTGRFNQRLSAWFLVLGNEDREAFLGGLKILELPCLLDVVAEGIAPVYRCARKRL